MSTSPSIPTVGAAMRSDKIPQYVEWLIADQRDLEIQDPAWYVILDSDWRPHVQHIRSMLDGYSGRLGIHGPFFSLDIAAVDPKIRAVVAERYIQALDFAAELGATHMVVHSPHNFLGTPFQPLTPTGGLIDYLQVIRDTLADVVAHAEKIGCTLVIENIFDRDPLVWINTVKAFNSDCVRASVDVGHAFVNYKLDAPPPDYWILEAGALLGHVHLQDTDGYADRHWIPGDGSINFRAIFDAIRSVNAQPRLIIEVADQDDILRAARWFSDQGLAK